ARPERPSSWMWQAACCRASQAASSRPREPRPPLMTTRPAELASGCCCGLNTTTLPTCRAWDICRSAAAALTSECAARGNGRRLPRLTPAATRRMADCTAASGRKSTATYPADTSGRSLCRRDTEKMSRLLISTKRPPRRSRLSVADTRPGLVSVFSATSTTPPRWPLMHCAAASSSTKPRSRLVDTWRTPRPRNRARLEGLPAVATTSAPRARTTCRDARPTPPVAPCTSTRSPGRSPAALPNTWWAVMKTVGMVAASSKLKQPGIATSVWGLLCTSVPRLPAARPNTAVPGGSSAASTPSPAATTTPAQSPPGAPGSPGYMPSTLSTSRKLTPTALTLSASLPAGTAPSSPVMGDGSCCGTRLPSAPRGRGTNWKEVFLPAPGSIVFRRASNVTPPLHTT
ncbi:hypothetical protein Vretimale_7413, partial [Volvox reticuliferus]